LHVALTAGAGVATAELARRSGRPQQARMRRRIERACIAATLTRPATDTWPAGRPPRMVGLRRTPAGWVVDIDVPHGLAQEHFEKLPPILAASLGCMVRVERIATPSRRRSHCRPAEGGVRLRIVERDLLAAGPPPWPFLSSPRMSLWEPIPVGIDEDGEQVLLRLLQRNLLLGGAMGAGKSSLLHIPVAVGCHDVDARVCLLDPSGGVELGRWAEVPGVELCDNPQDAPKFLHDLHADMESALLDQAAAGIRNVRHGDPLTLIVIDELQSLTAHGDTSIRSQCRSDLADLIGRGRKVGFIVVCATLRPTADVVPTFLRDLIQYRMAFRCTNAGGSDVILGDNWSKQGVSAHLIDDQAQGTALLDQGRRRPERMRGPYLDDADLDMLVARAKALRMPVFAARAAACVPAGSGPSAVELDARNARRIASAKARSSRRRPPKSLRVAPRPKGM
jgi:S-DNA-T family DNA segregation ATPase FtsK/SpoIIIE